MTKTPRLLVVSNGHGEDQIARRVCDAIFDILPNTKIKAVPLVGTGDAYSGDIRIECFKGAKPLPSGGFLRSFTSIAKDLGAGLLAQHQERRAVIREILGGANAWTDQSRQQDPWTGVDGIIAVGDVYALWMASGGTLSLGGMGSTTSNSSLDSSSFSSLMQKKAMQFMSKFDKKHQEFLTEEISTDPGIMFMPTAKSDRFMPHSALERQVIRRLARLTICRDQETADGLCAHGLRASYGGNPMFDGLLDAGKRPLKRFSGAVKLGILPGSREEALGNLELIAELLKSSKVESHIQVALAPSIDFSAIRTYFRDSLWVVYEDKLQHSRTGTTLSFSRDFLEVLYWSDLVIGLAGTANEQAAALNKRVICFKGTGPQSSKKRFLEQAKLMGERILFLDAKGRALHEQLDAILRDPKGHYVALPRSMPDAASSVAALICQGLDLVDK